MCLEEGYWASEAPLKVIMPAHEIPEGSIVTKRTGQKEYILKKKIVVYADKNISSAAITLEAQDVRYLVSDGAINAISSTLELVWNTNISELHRHLDDILEEIDSK